MKGMSRKGERILVSLFEMGGKADRITAIALAMEMRPEYLFLTVKHLQGIGMVSCQRDASRNKSIELTPKGSEAAAHLISIRNL